MAWAERIRHEMDAYDVMVPKLIGNEDYKGIIDYFTHFQRNYETVKLNVRYQLEKMDLNKNLFNASPETMLGYTGRMYRDEFDWVEVHHWLDYSK